MNMFFKETICYHIGENYYPFKLQNYQQGYIEFCNDIIYLTLYSGIRHIIDNIVKVEILKLSNINPQIRIVLNDHNIYLFVPSKYDKNLADENITLKLFKKLKCKK